MTARARSLAVAALAGVVAIAVADVDAGADTLVAPSPNTTAPTPVRVNAQAVQKAMQDEIARSMKDLQMGDEPRPYYVAYTISDVEQATTSATLGAVTASHSYRGRLLRTDLRVGDASFDNTNFEGGSRVESVPIEDDYAALRRELWLRSDEAYKTAVETLARKRAAAAGQAADEDDDGVGDFSKQAAAQLEVPFTAGPADPEALRETVRKLSLVLAGYPQIYGSQVLGTMVIVRRRLASSEGTWVDDNKRTLRIDVVADTQADDGMKLRNFVPFTALEPSGLPPLAGFGGKWLLLSAMIEKGWYGPAIMTLLATFVGFLYMARFIQAVFLGPRKAGHSRITDAPVALLIPQYLLIAGILVMSFFPKLLIEPVSRAIDPQFASTLVWQGMSLEMIYGYWNPVPVMLFAVAAAAILYGLFWLLRATGWPKSRGRSQLTIYDICKQVSTRLTPPWASEFWAALAVTVGALAGRTKLLYTGNGQTYNLYILYYFLALYLAAGGFRHL